MLVVPVEKRIDWKRPPIVLIILVIINFLMFAFYQSDDEQHANDAIETYVETGLFDIEWNAFKAFVREMDYNIELDKRNPQAVWLMATDDQFSDFVKDKQQYYINNKHLEQWRLERQSVEVHASKMSGTALALSVQKLNVLQLISHQFLHGDMNHLLGNMVFLILTGFAVEAAIGSLRFLSFYLLSGIGGGLLFALTAEPNSAGLVGASGAISGVMTMYVMLFKTKKIQFFYWFLIFTGYFRAMAIIMLPWYIGYELYQYFSNSTSNVAYTAHLGGFIVGAILIYITQKINKTAIDDDYVECKEERDPLGESIQKIYNQMAQCNFAQAWKMLKPLKAEHRNLASLTEIEYHLIRAQYPRKKNEYLLHRMDKPGNCKALIQDQLNYWKSLAPEQKQASAFTKKNQLLLNALELNALKPAEDIFNSLKESQEQKMEVASLARRIAIACRTQGRTDKEEHYNQLAQKSLISDYAETSPSFNSEQGEVS